MASVNSKDHYCHEVIKGKEKTYTGSQKATVGHKLRICFW